MYGRPNGGQSLHNLAARARFVIGSGLETVVSASHTEADAQPANNSGRQ